MAQSLVFVLQSQWTPPSFIQVYKIETWICPRLLLVAGCPSKLDPMLSFHLLNTSWSCPSSPSHPSFKSLNESVPNLLSLPLAWVSSIYPAKNHPSSFSKGQTSSSMVFRLKFKVLNNNSMTPPLQLIHAYPSSSVGSCAHISAHTSYSIKACGPFAHPSTSFQNALFILLLAIFHFSVQWITPSPGRLFQFPCWLWCPLSDTQSPQPRPPLLSHA